MPRVRAALFLLSPLLALAGLLAGCGGSGPKRPPSAAALVSASARAVRAQGPARFRFDTRARTDRVVPSPDAGPQIRRFTDNPLGTALRGAYSAEAIEATGSIEFSGQTLTADALAGARALYLRFFGTWYGTKQLGLDQLRRRAQARAGPLSGQAVDQAVGLLERYAKQVFKGPVTRGPKLDGVSTWQTEGTLDPNGLVPVAGGQEVTPRQRAMLQRAAGGTRVTYVVGRGDMLPRRVRVSLDLRPAELTRSGVAGAGYLGRIQRARATVEMDLSDWGQKVPFRAPPSYQPLDQLAGRFLGGLLGGGALGGGLLGGGALGQPQP